MSNENKRINLTQYEESFGGLLDAVLDGTCTLEDGEGHLHDRMQVIIAELKRCYEELDSLPAREALNKMHDHTKWLEKVESYFLADGSFNQDADFVRMCAVNNKYGYRIEVIDGVETVVHESEY